MSYIERLIFLSWIILFTVTLKASSALIIVNSEDKPTLERIIINVDSALVIPITDKESDKFLSKALVLDFRDNNISFELTQLENLQYQFFLEGFDSKWSRWKTFSIKEYTNLPAGKYIFRARVKGIDNNIIEAASFPFKVLPLWYLSHVAIIIYLLLISLIIWALYDFMNLRYAKRQYMLEQIINTRTEDLIIEKEKTEALLANLLPKNTADEIMSKGKATKVKYNFVTVLFSDIQGFTKIAEEMNPEVLIDELDKFFFYFDSVVEKYGIEKIKTIGDAYMCAGGIPEKNRTNPVEVILAAIEMRAYMTRLKETSDLEGMKYWDIRIGIHTGTIIAGVIGQKKMSYDIWGDTVNTASRMESSGEAGKINISGTTYEFVKEFFACEYRGKMPVKYKGELEMYFVNGIIPDLSNEEGKPNRKFILKMQRIKLQDLEDMVTKMFDDDAPPNLYFHNSSLVRNICNQVELISTSEKLPEEEYINLKLASLFLMTGFITDYENPMETSLRLVEETLPKYGFDQENIEITKRIIENSFTDHIVTFTDEILHDSKFDYLGRVDYIKFTEKLLRERREYGKQVDTDTWIEIQKKLLVDHEFRTNTARLLRSVSIEEQISGLQIYNV